MFRLQKRSRPHGDAVIEKNTQRVMRLASRTWDINMLSHNYVTTWIVTKIAGLYNGEG